MTDPSESVTRFKGSVPIGTTRPAGRIRQPEGSNVDPSGNEPGTRRVARSAAPAMAGSASRERFSMGRSEEHTSELQSHSDLVCRLLLEKKKKNHTPKTKTRTASHRQDNKYRIRLP